MLPISLSDWWGLSSCCQAPRTSSTAPQPTDTGWQHLPSNTHPPTTHYAHPKSQLHLSPPSHVCVCCIWSLGSKVSMRTPPRFSCPIVSCGNINIAATVARTRGTDTRPWSIERWKYIWEFQIWTFATRKLYFRPVILRFWGIIQDQRLPKIYVCI